VELIPVEGDSDGAMLNPEVILEIDGQSHTLTTSPWKGSAKNPMTWEDATEKFSRYAGLVIDKGQVSEIIEAIGDLDHASDMADIAKLVGTS